MKTRSRTPTGDAGNPDSPTGDDFLDGRLSLLQPRNGFRAGLDSVLLAAAVDQKSTKILDLGAGAGIATCCVLADLGHAEALLLDNNAEMLALAEKNLQHNGFSSRARVMRLDVTAKGAIREQAGLASDHFSSVIANPPFFETGAGTRPANTVLAAARQQVAGELDLWVKTAATSIAPGGEIIFVHLASSLPELLHAFARRFGAITLLPVVPHHDEAASRILLRGIKGSRTPMKVLSPLVLHGTEGHQFEPEINDILRGRSRLGW